MSAFVAEYAERSHAFVVAAPLREAFALFEPEGERAWAEGWDPHYLQPADGRVVRGMVFTTSHANEATVWMMVRHDVRPELVEGTALVEYVRTTPRSRIGRVLVQCTALDGARTRVNVVYALTGLSEAGNAVIRDLDAARYERFIEGWATSIERVLSGKRR